MPRLLPLLILLFAGVAAAAPDGGRLYATHCAACHGHRGEGGVGVPLALPAFLDSVSDRYLETTIRLGRPGRVMPAFGTLSEAEVEAIVAHIRSWRPGVRPPGFAERPVAGDRQRGARLYAEWCAECHGAEGEGGHGTGVTFSRPRNLPIIPPALNNSGFLRAASDRMIRHTLRYGREGTPMDAYLEKGLSERDIDDLVAYIRGFEENPRHWEPADDSTPVLVAESSYSLAETVENVKRAAVGMNFRIIREQRLEDGLFPEAEQNRDQVVIYFCNFRFINEALAVDPRVGIFMPCRVTVVERDGVVEVMSINPKYLSRLYNNAELDAACDQMYDIYATILDEATL